jgi:hypothetical protein
MSGITDTPEYAHAVEVLRQFDTPVQAMILFSASMPAEWMKYRAAMAKANEPKASHLKIVEN